MIHHTPFHRRGFTLIELLVVITIIVVLAGILLPAIIGAINTAQTKRAKAGAVSIQVAFQQYRAEYGKFPVTRHDGNKHWNAARNSSDGQQFLAVLLGDTSGTFGSFVQAMNPKGLVFLEADSEDNGDVWDPWEQNYYICLDADFDNRVTYGSGGSEYRSSVLVASRGPNMDLEDPKRVSESDDISTLKN